VPRILQAAAMTTLIFCGCGGGYQSKPYQPSTPSAEEVEWDRYHAAEKAGRADEALAGYEGMCQHEPTYPRACYDVSRLLFELERYTEAVDATIGFVTRFPDNPLVQPAVKRLGRYFADNSQVDHGTTTFEQLALAVKDSDAEDSVIYEIARLYRGAGRLDDEARELERIVAMGRWNSQLWNDSLWRLAELRAEQGDAAAEERLLEKLIDSDESSNLIGSYTTGLHDDAMLRLGELRLEQGRVDEAYDTFIELSRLQTSRGRDDGLLGAARVRIAQGRTADACKLLGKLLDKMPDASCHRDAQRLYDMTGCGNR